MNHRQYRPSEHEEQSINPSLLMFSLHSSISRVLDDGKEAEEGDDG
jgi:hypothetical protein